MKDISKKDIPTSDASFEEIGKFALTFDGCSGFDSLFKCADAGKMIWKAYEEGKGLPDDVNKLRAALYWEQRATRNQCCGGLSPEEEDATIEKSLRYMRVLLEKMREIVQ